MVVRVGDKCVGLSYLLCVGVLYGDSKAPDWWSERGVVLAEEGEKNDAVANVGQAKWMAKQALEELSVVAPELAQLVDLSAVVGEPPNVRDASWYTAQKSPLNIGQLKALAQPFYDALPAGWLANQAQKNGIDSWVGPYPWKVDTPEHENYKLANLGQLKAVFSLRFTQDVDVDGSGDGLIDLAEHYYFGGLGESADTDFDADGFSNLEEIARGANPRDSSDGDPEIIDSDEDGVVDAMDAVPHDPQINWNKVARRQYRWVNVSPLDIASEVLGGDQGAPVAINSRGQVLFSRDVWSANQWARLERDFDVSLSFEGETQKLADRLLHCTGINEDGWISGNSVGLTERVDSVGIVWRPMDSSLSTYSGPMYFAKKEPIESIEDGLKAVGRIANDGTILCSSRDSLGIFPSAKAGSSFTEIAEGEHYVPGASLNASIGLSWLLSETEDGLFTQLLLYRNGGLSAVGHASQDLIGEATRSSSSSISRVPVTQADAKERLWLTTHDSVYMESIISGTAATWIQPTSMEQGAYRVNAMGEAITRTQLWRNGVYEDLRSVVQASYPQKLVENFQAIDLADSGMILAKVDIDGVSQAGVLVPFEIVPDYNRDGVIDGKDRGLVDASNPFRWWVNSDADKAKKESRGENLNDVPEQGKDNDDSVVNGMSDLTDFFPVHLDLTEIVKLCPKETHHYVVSHPAAAINLIELADVEVDGSKQGLEANAHITDIEMATRLEKMELITLDEPHILSHTFLAAAALGKGVLLVEGIIKTKEPIMLEVRKHSGERVVKCEFPLTLCEVEDMYRHVNMRSILHGEGGRATQVDEPTGYPDALTNGEYVAYIHGYNISGEQARGSHSNLFKRLHQLGNQARYVGVNWFGDPDNPGLNLVFTPDYHKAVYQGFLTGDALVGSQGLGFTQDAKLTIMAHSLGNLVASHAIANQGLKVKKYFMINGAVPIQCYDAHQTSNESNHPDMMRNMTDDDWKPYYDYQGQRRLLAANWHASFFSSDKRSLLTWKNLFKKNDLTDVAYNFYSSSDQVMENPDDSEEFGHVDNILKTATQKGRHAWVAQEIVKGGTSAIAPTAFADLNGGWKFNPRRYRNKSVGSKPPGRWVRKLRKPRSASWLSTRSLQCVPFFRPFLYPNLHHPSAGSAEAGDVHKRYKILSTGVPASSYAIAVNALTILDQNADEVRNFDMMHVCKAPEVEWPAPFSRRPDDWLHSDFKDLPLVYVYPLYQKFIELGKLDKKRVVPANN